MLQSLFGIDLLRYFQELINIHVGLFVHYKPRNYEKIESDIQDVSDMFDEFDYSGKWKAKESEEPIYPVYSYNNYGIIDDD